MSEAASTFKHALQKLHATRWLCVTAGKKAEEEDGGLEAFFDVLAVMSASAYLIQMFYSTIVRAHVSLPQRAAVTPPRLEHDEMSPLALRLGEGGERGVGDPAIAVLRIEDIEMSFGNVDTDANRVIVIMPVPVLRGRFGAPRSTVQWDIQMRGAKPGLGGQRRESNGRSPAPLLLLYFFVRFLRNRSIATQFLFLQGAYVMSDKASEDWRNAAAREAKQRSAVAGAIGEHLRFKLSGIVNEPLPERMSALLSKLSEPERRAQPRCGR